MANQQLFNTTIAEARSADVRNDAGAPAYAFDARHALAQYAATGCLNGTFYASAELQLDAVLALCDQVAPDFVARTALYAREHGAMKDMPALLVAWLSVADAALCERVFERVIDDGKMLRNFVQIVRSGRIGRKSLGSMPKRLVQRWLEARSDEQLLRASVGAAPSLADIIKMAHPRPRTASRRALYGYLCARPYDVAALPPLVRALERFKRAGGELPDVPFQLLTALPLDRRAWTQICERASWTQLRMNLAAFARHDLFASRPLVQRVAARLRDANEVKRSKVLPYQLMAAYRATARGVPEAIREALEDAMETALANVPALDGKVYVCCDVSGSMSAPVTGFRRGATSKMRCIDVAALIAAALMRKNDAEVLAFEQSVVELTLSRRDRVMTNAAKLAAVGGGGTNCAAPLAQLNAQRARGELVVYVSDNESWMDARSGRETELMTQWLAFQQRNPRAKLVCIDLVPNRTTQAHDDGSILNIGGFSDAVFTLLGSFVEGDARHWADVIAATTL